MEFRKVRLHGFKSFVDPTELTIDSGITGVVGPNGCGKSNVIEALRWVMGETSAKRMRGGEMDDVIFGGASSRPQRNNAEVTVTLGNPERTAPAAFNDTDEIEISRRIERGQGSTYRINGQEVRARDVQLLFADLATGANSTAIVSQGRVGALIGAKPTDRRTLLEEAAGIRGLHSRRHEAELRLRAAETNLERLEDVIGALETQQQGLQRQVRQANRYRRIAEQLRGQEAIQLHLRWSEAGSTVEAAKARLKEAESNVATHTETAAVASRRQVEAVAALPELRKAEVEASAALQSLAVAKHQLEDEANRLRAAQADLETRLTQLADDIAREDALAGDAGAAMERLTAEKQRLEAERTGEAARAETAKTEREQADAAVAEKETTLQELTDHVAGVEAQRAGLIRAIEEAEARATRIAERAAALTEEQTRLQGELGEIGDPAAAGAAVTSAESALEEARVRAAGAEDTLTRTEAAATSAREAARSAEDSARTAEADARRAGDAEVAEAERAARETVAEARSALSEITAEQSALEKILGTEEIGDMPPVVDSVNVEPGFETALGAALGDDLEASLDSTASRHWRVLPQLRDAGGLPAGASPLGDYVRGPAALARRLARIGVVADAGDAERLQVELPVGYRLVSRDGGLWRWDGLSVKPGTATAAAQRLAQRNRLEELVGVRADAEKTLRDAEEAGETSVAEARAAAETRLANAAQAATETLDRLTAENEAAGAAYEQALAAAREARDAQQQAYATLDQNRKALAELENRTADLRSRLTSIAEELARLQGDKQETDDRIAASRQALNVLEDPNAARERLSRLRAEVADLRANQVEKRSAHDRLAREAEARRHRLEAIAQEEASWGGRAKGAVERKANLQARFEAAEKEKVALDARPAAIEAKTKELLDRLGEAEAKRSDAADKLAKAEVEQAEADRGLRAAEGDLASARETRVRREAEVEQAEQAAKVVSDRILERLECRPDQVLAEGGIDPEKPLPPLSEVEGRIERLNRERDNIGAVNLRAEQESDELSEQIESMTNEREDLIAAINRLRHGIGALNREGRERLLAAFEKVDGYFRELFVRLFGGGEAKLALTENDDPLQAGLEIMASPPGKKMQILSLLSGGEQALTAIALLFAVFQTNPAPICILDEVDAPLDDANVDRFCTMLDEMAHTGSTRFLLVTHHRMSMARVDRLFGVTMAERGVSQLVSVDLRQAERLRDQAA